MKTISRDELREKLDRKDDFKLVMTHVSGLQRRLGDRMCFVFRHFPALAANAQGKFWKMHNHLFRNQKALTYNDLLGYATELGLNLTQFKEGMEAHIFDGRISRDRQSWWDSGVRSIPTFFINEIRYQGENKLTAILGAIENW